MQLRTKAFPDQWFEEDQPIYVHPKDPYKRIDILPSSRRVTVKVAGTVVADSSNNMFLYETGLKPRYYLPLTSVGRVFIEVACRADLTTG